MDRIGEFNGKGVTSSLIGQCSVGLNIINNELKRVGTEHTLYELNKGLLVNNPSFLSEAPFIPFIKWVHSMPYA